MNRLALPHPDAITGALSEVLQWIAGPTRNSLARLESYRGVALADFFGDPGPPARVDTRRRWALPGVVSEDLVFPSRYEPLEPGFREVYRSRYRASHTVYARRIRPRGSEGRPRLLYLHGYMQPETLVEELGLLAGLALWLDVELVQLQPPYHGRRRPAGSRFSGEYYWTADLVRSFEALRQTVLDARALLGWLLREDPRPVGVTGISLGGLLTAVLTCVEPRFAFSMPLIAHMDLAALVADAPVLGRMRRDLERFGWSLRDFGDFVDSLGWGELRPQLAPERIAIFAASEDRFFDPRVVEAMWRRWGEPAIHWYPTSHMGFIPRLPLAARRMRGVVERCAGAGVPRP